MSRIIAILTLSFFTIAGLYFGIGGALMTENYNVVSSQYNFNSADSVIDAHSGISFKNIAEMNLWKENEKSKDIFPFITYLPEFVGNIFTACFFGLIGGVISILKKIAWENNLPEHTKFISIPLLSFFTGIVVIGLYTIIPNILLTGENKIRPLTLLFLSLFGGLYSIQFYSSLSKAVQTKFYGG